MPRKVISLTESSLEIDGPGVKAKATEHESGLPSIFFRPFYPTALTADKVENLIVTAKEKLASQAGIVSVYLQCCQSTEQKVLEDIGFRVDGYEYEIELKNIAIIDRNMPQGFSVRKCVYDLDIDQIINLEIAAHRSDPSSRVEFETPEAVAGVGRYYQRIAADLGVYVLMLEESIVGIMGFLPEDHQANAVHISSVAIRVDWQGNGLFFPFLAHVLPLLKIDGLKKMTGVTTTKRLIQMAKKYNVRQIGVNLSRVQGKRFGFY